jgi:hypothetical protein
MRIQRPFDAALAYLTATDRAELVLRQVAAQASMTVATSDAAALVDGIVEG